MRDRDRDRQCATTKSSSADVAFSQGKILTFSASDSNVLGYALSYGWKCWAFGCSVITGGGGG